jgi:hypothetical protein
MAVWLMRRLPCADPVYTADGIAIAIEGDVVAPPLGEELTLSRADIIDAGRVGAPTHDRRNDVLCTRERKQAPIHGGAIG